MSGVKVGIGADASKAERELSSFERKTRKIAKSIQKGFQERIGHKLFDGLTGAARAVPGMLNEAIQSASSLNEEISKSETIFGGSAAEIRKWAKGAAESMGLSEVAALEASGTIGNMFTAMGMTGKESADMSKAMVGLAADLGSFNNTSTDDAIQAIGAALRGESEPIRRYGVLLDDATLKAEAFAKGLYNGKGTLEPASRALAAYSVILKQTTAAQGDFAKTSDGLANSQKILDAELKNASTEIGKALLPAMSALVKLMRDIDWQSVGKDIGALAESFISLSRNVGDAYNSFRSFAEQSMITLGILKDIKKEMPDMTRFAGEFEAPARTEEDERFDRGTKALMDAAERERLKAADGRKTSDEKVNQIKAELEYQRRLYSLQEDLRENEIKHAKEMAKLREAEFRDLSLKEAEALAEFGMNAAALKQSRTDELVSMGLSRDDASNIAGRESNLEKLRRTQDILSSMAGRSSIAAVSSMQRIGGGGGVSTELDIQKRQANLQEQMVELLKGIKEQNPRKSISDF